MSHRMNRFALHLFTLFIVFILYLPTSFAQNYTQFSLPAGAKARIGKGTIGYMQYSPDGTLLAVSSSIGIWFYDIETYQERTLLPIRYNIHGTQFKRSLSRIAFQSNEKIIEVYDSVRLLWDISTGSFLGFFDHRGEHKEILAPKTSTVVSPDERVLATHGGRRNPDIVLSDVDTGEVKKTLAWQVFDADRESEFATDGKTFIFITQGHDINVWSVATGEQQRTLTGHTADVISVALGREGQMLASGSKDKTIRLWQPHSGKHLKTLTGHDADVPSVVFSPDGQVLASGGADKTIRLWNVQTNEHLKTFTKHNAAVTSVSFSNDGKTLVSGDRAGGVYLWDVATGILQKTFIGHIEPVVRVLLSPNGRTLAAQTRYDSIRMWDVATGILQKTLAGRVPIWCMWFTPDGVLLAASVEGKVVFMGSTEYHHGSDRDIRLWDVLKGQQKKILIGHTGWVSHLSVSLDGHTLASAAIDNTAILWDLTDINRTADSSE